MQLAKDKAVVEPRDLASVIRESFGRELHPPGTFFKYNDVRVNLLAYALLQVWREPLPVVLKREVMDPIGASTTWRWHGYENSWVTLDGQKMQSVSGGGQFGGGLFTSTLDHAGFGLLFLRQLHLDRPGKRSAHRPAVGAGPGGGSQRRHGVYTQ